jgi:DNA mismatch endonuclease, patch repair protein
MAAVRGRNTQPELTLRRALHAGGLRYRVHPGNIPGRPDLANCKRKIAIFVDGDYWHGNPDEWRRRGYETLEAQFREDKRDFWVGKISRTIRRDREITISLEADGWTVIRVWESVIQRDLEGAVARIMDAWR